MTRLEKLKALEVKLADALENAQTSEMASLARQYRATLEEIELLEGAEKNDDDIAKILDERSNLGKPGTVRPNRS